MLLFVADVTKKLYLHGKAINSLLCAIRVYDTHCPQSPMLNVCVAVYVCGKGKDQVLFKTCGMFLKNGAMLAKCDCHNNYNRVITEYHKCCCKCCNGNSFLVPTSVMVSCCHNKMYTMMVECSFQKLI